MNILITGVAGIISVALAKTLLNRDDTILGIDNLSDYCDVNLKSSHLSEIEKINNFIFLKLDMSGREALKKLIQI